MPRTGRIDWRTLQKDLRRGEMESVYFLHGPEAFLKEEAVSALREAVLGREEAEDRGGWNLTLFDGSSTNLGEILDAARTLPMLGRSRLVIVKEAEKIKDPDTKALREYLKRPEPTCCLIFVTGAGKPDLRRSLFRLLASEGTAVEFKPLNGPAVWRWIRERVKAERSTIDEDALVRLEAYLGNDLLRIHQELEKVLEFLRPERHIRLSALEETLGTGTTGSVFELAERTTAGEVGEAVALLREMLAEGEKPVRLLFFLTRQVRMLAVGKALMRRGVRGGDLASALGVPPIPPIIEKTQRQIERFPEPAGGPSLRRLLQADRALKSGQGSEVGVMEALVLDLGDIIGASHRAAERPA